MTNVLTSVATIPVGHTPPPPIAHIASEKLVAKTQAFIDDLISLSPTAERLLSEPPLALPVPSEPAAIDNQSHTPLFSRPFTDEGAGFIAVSSNISISSVTISASNQESDNVGNQHIAASQTGSTISVFKASVSLSFSALSFSSTTSGNSKAQFSTLSLSISRISNTIRTGFPSGFTNFTSAHNLRSRYLEGAVKSVINTFSKTQPEAFTEILSNVVESFKPVEKFNKIEPTNPGLISAEVTKALLDEIVV